MDFKFLPNPPKARYYTTYVECGLFGVADDFSEDYLSLDEKFLTKKESTFFVRAGGDSMTPEIKPNDILIVHRSAKLFHGCLAAFYFNNHAICKQYLKTPTGIILHSFNPSYKDIIIAEDDSLQLFGVVVGLARDM